MIINLTLPTCWQELTPEQLRYVFFLLTQNYTAEEIKTFCLCRFSGLKVVGRVGHGLHRVTYDHMSYLLSTQQIAEQLAALDWLDNIPLVPVRLPQIGKHTAVAADLSGVPFSDFLALDNFYQGYLHTQRTDLLRDMAAILYNADDITLSDEESVSIFYWFAAVKSYYARRFSYLFSEKKDTNQLASMQSMEQRLQTAMDNQIRALTKGDVTKEAEVLATDTIRALTELNAMAKEYDELQQEMKK